MTVKADTAQSRDACAEKDCVPRRGDVGGRRRRRELLPAPRVALGLRFPSQFVPAVVVDVDPTGRSSVRPRLVRQHQAAHTQY